MSLKSRRAYDAHRFWQKITLNQLSAANNWLLGVATGFLSFCVPNKEIHSLCNLEYFLFISLCLSVFSIFAGTVVLISRLFDFRITRAITRRKKEFYEHGGEKFPDNNSDKSGCCQLLGTFIRVLFCTVIHDFSKDQIQSLNGYHEDYMCVKNLAKMRQDAHNLGIITWKFIKFQSFFFFLAVLLYICHIW
jgi:hypothetical protein